MEQTKKNKIWQIAQPMLIIILLCICFFLYKRGTNKEIVTNTVEKTETSYKETYQAQRIKELEDENKALYDSIKHIKNVESAVEIKYIYKHTTDTIFTPSTANNKDSIYHYTYDNDTVKYNIDIMAKDLKWHKSSFELHDKFTIISTLDDDNVSTSIEHSPNVEIEDVTLWKKKKNFWDNFYYGPSIGAGYGVFSKKVDVYVGFSLGYKF